jgi:chorismate synthase
MGVVAESMMALVLANEALRKFGGDSLAEIVRNRDGYLGALGSTPSAAAGRPRSGPGSATG